MPYIVLKSIPLGNGTKIAPGTLVAAENWRNRRSLELGRYIQRVEVGNSVDAIVADEVDTEEPSVEETPAKKKVGRPPKTDKKG
jgi:hypothetical protein